MSDALENGRYLCRNPRCRSRLKAPADNPHHAFCSKGCHQVFYRSRCLVCEEAMQRATDRQRFKSGHKTCESEFRRFSHVYEYSEHAKRMFSTVHGKTDVSLQEVPILSDLKSAIFDVEAARRASRVRIAGPASVLNVELPII